MLFHFLCLPFALDIESMNEVFTDKVINFFSTNLLIYCEESKQMQRFLMINPDIGTLFYIDGGVKKKQTISYYLFDLIG
jgi:hypothetical protein